MAETPIQNPSGWISIFNRLGITKAFPWRLSDLVLPVALVDSEITLNATASTPLVGVPFSLGEQGAPAANTRLANSGALPAGPYSITIWMGHNDSLGQSFRIRRRNAADTADIWSHRFFAAAQNFFNVSFRAQLALNEFIVVENPSAGGVGTVWQASMFVNSG